MFALSFEHSGSTQCGAERFQSNVTRWSWSQSAVRANANASRSLTVEEFRMFVDRLEEPIHTIALVCVCFGLRISECLALKWRDVNWLSSKLAIERAIVRQRVGDVKTIYSGTPDGDRCRDT